MKSKRVSDDRHESHSGVVWWHIAVPLVVAFGSWCAYLFLALSTTSPDWFPNLLRLPSPSDNNSTLMMRGQFGDAFGAFNALVSTIALVVLYFTLKAQQIQLKSQQRQGEATNRLFKQQQFQDQFYRAIDAYRTLLSDITVRHKPAESEIVHMGRQALNSLWRYSLVARLPAEFNDKFEFARRAQKEASSDEFISTLKHLRNAEVAINQFAASLKVDAALAQEVLGAIGRTWYTLYQANRFQLDALFRAWYTVYRILDTAKNYEIPASAIDLYSAMFRAQLSWVEMAFLLVNQSSLPEAPAFPRACFYSNEYAVFDNLASEQDVVVTVLKLRAQAGERSEDREVAVLTRAAFETGGISSHQAHPPTV